MCNGENGTIKCRLRLPPSFSLSFPVFLKRRRRSKEMGGFSGITIIVVVEVEESIGRKQEPKFDKLR